MVKFAVIGLGRMGARHAFNLAKGAVKGANLVAVCDIDAQVADDFAAKHSVAAYHDYKSLIDARVADAVVIATPHYSHGEISDYSVAHGVHTLVEKPLAVTALEAERMIANARANDGVIYAMMYNQRTNPLYARLKRMIDDKQLGEIQRVDFTVTDWYRTQYYYDMGGWRASWSGEGGGTLINQCVHQLDLMQWILGMPSSVLCKCATKGRNITTENDVTALFEYDGFDCVFRASTHELPGVNRLEIAGSRGAATVSSGVLTIKTLKMDESEVNARSTRDYGNKRDKKYKVKRKFYGIGNYLYDWRYGQQCRVLNDFAAAIENKDQSLLTARGDEGLHAVRLINAMNASAWSGDRAIIPVDKENYDAQLRQKIAAELADKQ